MSISLMDIPWLGLYMVRSKQEPEVDVYLRIGKSCVNSYMLLGSLAFRSTINKFCFLEDVYKSDYQILILAPLLQGFNSSMACSTFPY